MTQLTNNIYAVEVPYKVTDFKSFVKSVKSDEADVGKFKFLFTTKTATEEDARKVVKCYGGKYIDYEATEQDYKEQVVTWYDNALLSLYSLLRSKRLDDKNNYALIEK